MKGVNIFWIFVVLVKLAASYPFSEEYQRAQSWQKPPHYDLAQTQPELSGNKNAYRPYEYPYDQQLPINTNQEQWTQTNDNNQISAQVPSTYPPYHLQMLINSLKNNEVTDQASSISLNDPIIQDLLAHTKHKKKYLVIHPDGTVQHVDNIDTIAKQNPNYVLLKAGNVRNNHQNTADVKQFLSSAEASETKSDTIETTLSSNLRPAIISSESAQKSYYLSSTLRPFPIPKKTSSIPLLASPIPVKSSKQVEEVKDRLNSYLKIEADKETTKESAYVIASQEKPTTNELDVTAVLPPIGQLADNTTSNPLLASPIPIKPSKQLKEAIYSFGVDTKTDSDKEPVKEFPNVNVNQGKPTTNEFDVTKATPPIGQLADNTTSNPLLASPIPVKPRKQLKVAIDSLVVDKKTTTNELNVTAALPPIGQLADNTTSNPLLASPIPIKPSKQLKEAIYSFGVDTKTDSDKQPVKESPDANVYQEKPTTNEFDVREAKPPIGQLANNTSSNPLLASPIPNKQILLHKGKKDFLTTDSTTKSDSESLNPTLYKSSSKTVPSESAGETSDLSNDSEDTKKAETIKSSTKPNSSEPNPPDVIEITEELNPASKVTKNVETAEKTTPTDEPETLPFPKDTTGLDISKIKTQTNPAIWFRTTDQDFWDKVMGTDKYNVVYFIQMPPQPAIEKETKKTVFSNGTILEEITEIEKNSDEDEPKITKSVRFIEPDSPENEDDEE